MNNKYLSGLLAGMLTAGTVQGSGNEGNMPGLGGEQTPVLQGQDTGITEELRAAASELAAAYNEYAAGIPNEEKKKEFKEKAQALRDEFGVESLNGKENKSDREKYSKKLSEYYRKKAKQKDNEQKTDEAKWYKNFAIELYNDFLLVNDDYYDFRASATLEEAASELAATYDERAAASQSEEKKNEFRAKAKALRDEFRVENAKEFHPDAEDRVQLQEMRYNYAKKLAEYYTNKGDITFARDLKNDFAHLDMYTTQLAGMQFTSDVDFRNLKIGSANFEQRNELHINNIPIRSQKDAETLFPKLETQQIFGPDDFIVNNMYQYIITYPVTNEEIHTWVARLQNIRNDQTIKNRNITNKTKPIVFQAQKFETRTIRPVTETQDFEIKSYWCNMYENNRRVNAGDYYRRLENYNKPIIFGKTERDLEFGTGIRVKYHDNEVSYQKYSELVQTYGNDFFVDFVRIETTSTKELKEQLEVLIKSKNVNQIRVPNEIPIDVSSIPLEYLGCVKIREMSFSNYENPNGELFLIRTMIGDINNVKCKSIYCFEAPYSVENTIVNRVYERIGVGNSYELSDNQRKYIGNVPEEVNEHLREKEKAYIQYIKNHGLEYLSGYVNIDNKPAELSEDEWSKVIILKGKAEEIKVLMR